MRYSSHNQDERIASYFPDGFVGMAVDVGANDGLFYSNTKALEDKGWRVLCVEANPIYDEDLRVNRREHVIAAAYKDNVSAMPFQIVYSHSGPVGKPFAANSRLDKHGKTSVRARTLNNILHELSFNRVDLLCVDVEGDELDVLRGFDLHGYKPYLLVLECSTDDAFDDTIQYLLPLGYEYRESVDVDRFFTRPL